MLQGEKFQVIIKSEQILDIGEAIEFVQSTKCGAVNLFQGTIRDSDIGDRHKLATGALEPISAIYYEAYESMAKKQIIHIIESCMKASDPNMRVFVAIRIGTVPVGESSILICVSSTGRQTSHAAVLTILNEIKSKVAIWKKIIYLDGREEWAAQVKSEAFWLAASESSS